MKASIRQALEEIRTLPQPVRPSELESKPKRICGIVGELTLAVDKLNGRLHMPDFGPAENGDRAINQIETIRQGLRKLGAAVA